MENPFSTTFGLEPNNYIKRISEENKIISDFNSINPSNYVYLITGIRGSGKTVLLSSISDEFDKDDKWIVIDPESKENILETIASELYENGKMKHLFTKAEFNFSFQGISLSIHGENPVSSTFSLLKKMLDHVKKKGKKVLITIDEVDNSNELKNFIQTYQTLIRQKYPIMLLMTGLYENVSRLQDDKSLTFLYRAIKIQLGPLSIRTIAVRYQQYLQINEDTSLKLAKMTKGFAYAYQVLGYLFFEKERKEIDLELLAEYDQYLSDYVYEKVYSGLSSKEKEIVLAMGSDENVEIVNIKEKLNMDDKTMGVYRDRLIKKGVIVPVSYGVITFSLPRFNEFLKVK